ncbi:MAG: type II toxin-antitoxin system VapC family toxin [Actinobacteria bacterium]|nr:type II toxin-antitoxin system VapC family toxin [Actinomycetota bacterium]
MLYLDSSAIVKLVAREAGTTELVQTVRADPEVVSSALAWTEVVRAVRRSGGRSARAEAVLERIALVPIDDGIIRSASRLFPTTLRTLDAIHLATALSLEADLAALVTYDERLAGAGRRTGLEVRAPGA